MTETYTCQHCWRQFQMGASWAYGTICRECHDAGHNIEPRRCEKCHSAAVEITSYHAEKPIWNVHIST